MRKPRQLPLWPTGRNVPAELPEARRILGENVRALRRSRHLTQEMLAERVGLHPSSLGRIERGARNVHLDTISRLAWALRQDVSALLRERKRPAETPTAASTLIKKRRR